MQRVAIGRALVRRPKAMLMDEPIGALDAKLREEMRAEIKRLHIKQGSTTIYVTHDQIEAMSLADRIVIMHEGVLQQVGSPDEVYSHPANLFVAQFVGSPVMNVADASVTEKAVVGLGDGRRSGQPASSSRARCCRSSTAMPAASSHSASGRKASSFATTRREGFLPVETQIVEPLGSFDIVDIKVGSEMLRARTKSGFVERTRREGLCQDRSDPDAFLRHGERQVAWSETVTAEGREKPTIWLFEQSNARSLV